MTEESPIRHRGDLFSVMLSNCTAAVLAHVLDPAVPFVWLRGYVPQPRVQWWSATVPLAASGVPRRVEVRGLAFDLQFGTAAFLDALPEFEHAGLELFQMTRRVPDTLTLDRVPDAAVNGVLVRNGLHLKFVLPHAHECAQLSSPHRPVLEAALRNPALAAIAY